MIFTHTPDRQILISVDDEKYIDSLDAFIADTATLHLPYEMWKNFRSLSYKNKILVRWTENEQIIDTDGWAFGDKIFARFDELLKAQQVRLNPPKPEPTLPEIKSLGERTAYQLCAQARIAIAGTTDQIKVASWSNYRALAEAYAQGVLSQTDQNALLTEIKIRNKNETLEQFVGKILANADRYTQASAVITGAEKLTIDSIASATDPSGVDQALKVLQGHLGSLNAKV
jgi:hypothetical protein